MIYFVQAEIIGRIKIGFTSSGRLEKRLAALQTASPVKLHLLATCPGSLAGEQKLHDRFAPARVSGEWFDPTPKLVRLIARLQGKRAGDHRRSTPKVARGERASLWLREVFGSRSEVASAELMRLARDAGISREALYSVNVTDMAFRKEKRSLPDGTVAWFWVAPENRADEKLRESWEFGNLQT